MREITTISSPQMVSLEARPISSQPVIIRGRGKNKKFWNVKEESTLIDILSELNGTSWKTDSGYKNGYCYYVEQQMEEKLPGCGLKADPHIESKIKTLKRHLAYILAIEDHGDGFWWDDEQKMVVGSKEAFLSWAKNHEGASSLFMKPFVHYDKLCEIFGKRRPAKKRVQVTAEAVAVDPPLAYIRSSETQSNVREEATSITQSTITLPCEPRNENSKRSRVFDPSESEFLEMSKTIRSLAESQKDLTLTMINMKKASTHDVEISELRKKLFSALMKLPGLSPLDVVKAARSIGQDDRKVEVFFSMPDDYKVMFAHLEIDASE